MTTISQHNKRINYLSYIAFAFILFGGGCGDKKESTVTDLKSFNKSSPSTSQRQLQFLSLLLQHNFSGARRLLNVALNKKKEFEKYNNCIQYSETNKNEKTTINIEWNNKKCRLGYPDNNFQISGYEIFQIVNVNNQIKEIYYKTKNLVLLVADTSSPLDVDSSFKFIDSSENETKTFNFSQNLFFGSEKSGKTSELITEITASGKYELKSQGLVTDHLESLLDYKTYKLGSQGQKLFSANHVLKMENASSTLKEDSNFVYINECGLPTGSFTGEFNYNKKQKTKFHLIMNNLQNVFQNIKGSEKPLKQLKCSVNKPHFLASLIYYLNRNNQIKTGIVF
jgi:hypothetical protein